MPERRSKRACAWLQVQHMGVTISPLRLDCWHSAGKPPVDSPESLITVVARAGLGGVFSVGWLAWPLRIFSSSWLNSLLLSIVQARPCCFVGVASTTPPSLLGAKCSAAYVRAACARVQRCLSGASAGEPPFFIIKTRDNFGGKFSTTFA